MGEVVNLDATRHAQDLRETWQGRVLALTERRPIGAIVLSVLAHNFDDQLPTLLHCVFPGFDGLKPPGLCSAGKIDKTGAVVADVFDRYGRHIKDAVLFTSTEHLQWAFRDLADGLKLSDEDRRDLFTCVNRWLVADRRLDPTMDPSDPDAKRLVH